MTCNEAVIYIENIEKQDQIRAAEIVKMLSLEIEAFVNKRKNIFTALKMDI